MPLHLTLNGTKTHPLKPASIEVLRRLKRRPMKGYMINPGIRDRLSREALAEVDEKHNVWVITAAGIEALEKIGRK